MIRRAAVLLVLSSACSSSTGPSEPARELTLPAGVTLASGQYGFDVTTREYTIFLGLRNETAQAVEIRYGLCTFLVAGFSTPAVTGTRLWTRLLPQVNGCGPDLALTLRVARARPPLSPWERCPVTCWRAGNTSA